MIHLKNCPEMELSRVKFLKFVLFLNFGVFEQTFGKKCSRKELPYEKVIFRELLENNLLKKNSVKNVRHG